MKKKIVAVGAPAAPKKPMDRAQLATYVGRLISNERSETHGDPHAQFECQQILLNTLMEFWHGDEPSTTTMHALQMITTKLSRLACGQNIQDSWLDTAGYALIAAEKAGETAVKNLTDYEIEILEECAGLKLARPWGAAVGVALEILEGAGFIDKGYVTPAGWAFLDARAEKPEAAK